MAKKIKMLKAGRFKSMSGKVVEFTEADLKATAAAYNPEIYAAPFVLGHPKHDDPAYGRVGTAEFGDGFLWGTPAQVDPAFAEAVNAGKFNQVSLSLYEPDSPNNPVPGVYYPRHLGFLGAMPPAVKGLGTVSFSEEETGVVSFGDWNDRTIARMFRGIKNFLIGEFGQEKADKVIDEWDLQSVTEDAVKPETPAGTCAACGMPCAECCCSTDDSTTDFGDHHQPGGNMTLTAKELADKEAALKRREEALLSKENGAKHLAHVDFAEGLIKAGKLLAVNKAAVVAVLDFAEGIATGDTIEFGEGDVKKSQAPAQILKDLLSAAPKVIEFGEMGGGEEPGKKTEPIPGDIARFI